MEPLTTLAPSGDAGARAPLPADDLRQTLWALVDASAAAAGAVCLFDAEDAILRLVAEVGLSDEGCRTLRAIRPEKQGWDPPLRCVLDQRTYVLQDAPPHPVPPLVEAAGPISSVACIPLRGRDCVWGSVLLVATPPFSLGDAELRNLQAQVDDITAAVAALHGHVAAVARSTARWHLLDAAADAACNAVELASSRTRRVLDSVGYMPVVGRAVRRLRRGNAEVESRLRQLDRMAQSFWRRLRLLEVSAREREAEDGALRTRLYDAEARVCRERSRVEALEREHARLTADLDSALARAQQTHRTACSVVERSAAERDSALRSAHTVADRAEAARAAAADALEKARSQLVALQADVLHATEATRRAQQEGERARADADTAIAERQRQAAALQRAREREADLAARVTDLEQQLCQRRVDPAELEALDAALRARLYDAEARLTRERQRFRALDDDRKHLSAELAAATTRERSLRDELAAAITRATAEREDALRHARKLVDEAEQARAAAVAGAEAARAALIQVERSAAEADEEARQAKAQVQLLEAAHATTMAERERLAAALEAARARGAEAIASLAARDPSTPPAAAPGTAPSTPPPARSSVDRARSTTAHGRMVVAVLDADTAWGEATAEGMKVHVLQPTSAVAEQIEKLAPAHIVVNLTLPGAFGALTALRKAGCRVPFHACLTQPGRDDTVMLGTVEIGVAPLDVEAVLAWLTQTAARGNRVLAAGSNVNAYISLREALARAGFSVAMAWDTKQAADLIGIVRPQVGIVDLGLAPRGGAPLVVELCSQDPPPPILLIPDGRDPAPGFARALAEVGTTAHRLARGLCLAKIDAC